MIESLMRKTEIVTAVRDAVPYTARMQHVRLNELLMNNLYNGYLAPKG